MLQNKTRIDTKTGEIDYISKEESDFMKKEISGDKFSAVLEKALTEAVQAGLDDGYLFIHEK